MDGLYFYNPVFHDTYNKSMSQILCIRKRETVVCLQYVYGLNTVYQKEGNCIIPTICLCSRLCESGRGKLYRTYSIFMIQTFCIRKRKTVSYLEFVYVQDFVYEKEGHFIIPTICLSSRLCVSYRGKLYHTYSMLMIQPLSISKN